MDECKAHGHLKDRVEKLENNHNGLYDRVRDNETKYMPAVEAAFKAQKEVQAVKDEMNERLANITQSDTIQDIKLDAVMDRMDIADMQRGAQAAAIDSVHDEITKFRGIAKVLAWIATLLTVSILGFGRWLVVSIHENHTDIKVFKEIILKDKG